MFYGFQGRVSTTGQLTALSTIAYDAVCLNKFRSSVSEADFRWSADLPYPLDKPEEPEEETEEPTDDDTGEPEEPEEEQEIDDEQEEEVDGGAIVDTEEKELVTIEDEGGNTGSVLGVIFLIAIIAAVILVCFFQCRNPEGCCRQCLASITKRKSPQD